jgi:hypothetical protein
MILATGPRTKGKIPLENARYPTKSPDKKIGMARRYEYFRAIFGISSPFRRTLTPKKIDGSPQRARNPNVVAHQTGDGRPSPTSEKFMLMDTNVKIRPRRRLMMDPKKANIKKSVF